MIFDMLHVLVSMHVLITQYICIICHLQHSSTAKNIPLVPSAMMKTRAINGYFETSTQTMGKLLSFQRSSNIEEYNNQDRTKKTLQDVITRWWSTFRSLRRFRWLKKAIKVIIATEQVMLDDLTTEEWLLLHQIEIVLETMAC